MPKTKEDICASKQNESGDKTIQQAPHPCGELLVQNRVLAVGMWWDSLWYSLNYTQMLFGKALDDWGQNHTRDILTAKEYVSPWDWVQSLYSLLTQM